MPPARTQGQMHSERAHVDVTLGFSLSFAAALVNKGLTVLQWPHPSHTDDEMYLADRCSAHLHGA